MDQTGHGPPEGVDRLAPDRSPPINGIYEASPPSSPHIRIGYFWEAGKADKGCLEMPKAKIDYLIFQKP